MKSNICKSLVLLFVGVVFANPAVARQQDISGLTEFPVPAWPEKGIVPAELKEKYVFVDLAKNEYVVAYPENLGTDAFAKDGPGSMRINRYELLRNVVPTVSLTVTAVNPSRFKYAYTVSNGISAKQSIDQFVLVLPDRRPNDTIKNLDGWHAILQKSRTFKLKNPEWIRSGAAAVWSFQRPEQVIPPGSMKNGFEMESELRPGYTVAYLRKAESVDVRVATHGNVPKEVKEQIDGLLALEYNSRTALTLGPKFDKTVDDQTVAADFVQGIFALTRTGVLELNSDFVRNTLSELTGIKPGAGTSGIKITAPARTPAEIEVFNALKAALKMD